MNTHYGKSRFVRQKQSTKSGIEDNTPEEEEFKKYKELIERLDGEFRNKSGKVKINSIYSSSINTGGPSNGNNKSSYMRRTASRTKEVLNDRDFLINFMNNDTMPISPKNMHLLSDNDTNQSISDEIKYKNLADLMIDDKETVVETHFVKNIDDKMILKLYTALSRKSKDVFMDENHDEQSKNRVLFHKLNNIKMPKNEIYDPSLNDNNENDDNLNEDNLNDSNYSIQENDTRKNKNSIYKKSTKSNLKKNKLNIDNKINISNNNIKSEIDDENNGEEENGENKKEKEENNKLEFNENCKYIKNNKNNIIKIPKLHPYNPYLDKYHSRRFHKFRPKNLWDPDIDGDFLAYINHNIICIEDIYNKDKDKSLNINNSREEEIKPIEAKEIIYDNGSNLSDYNSSKSNENDNKEDKKNKSMDNNSQKKDLSNIQEEEENENRIKNKFCEFKDRHPNLIEISLAVDPTKQKINAFHNELKDIYYDKINEVGEFAEDIFPPKGVDLKSLKIYRYALNNERNEEKSIDSFTILPTAKSTPPLTPKNQKKENSLNNLTKRKKTMVNIYNRRVNDENLFKKKSQDNLNIKLNISSSGLLNKKKEKEMSKENEDENENENENEIKNNFEDNFLNEKEIKNNDDISLDKKSFSGKLDKIFNSGSFKLNNANNEGEGFENNENAQKSGGVETNKNFEVSSINDINIEINNNDNNNENNKENHNHDIESKNIISDVSHSHIFGQENKNYELNLSSSNQNSED